MPPGRFMLMENPGALICLVSIRTIHFNAGTTNPKGTTMPQAIMDPEQVRRFAEELNRFNADLQNRMGSLSARFKALGDTWKDQEHDKFQEEFLQTMKTLKKFADASARFSPYLLRKAQRIEEYLNQR